MSVREWDSVSGGIRSKRQARVGQIEGRVAQDLRGSHLATGYAKTIKTY